MTTSSPSQPTLREFVTPITRHRWLLTITILAAIGASVLLSSGQERVYRATATIGISDESGNLGVAGVVAPATRTPAQVALAGAQVVRTSAVVSRAQRDLKSSLSGRQLLDDISTTVDPQSNLVAVVGEASSGRDAQQLANAFAKAAVDVSNEASRAEYAAQARALRKRRPKGKASDEARSQYNIQISRLKALSTISAPATLVEPARRPQNPVSPKPVRNAIFAAFLGIVLGLALVFLRDSFDRRLHSPRDIAAELRLPLIGHVRDEALGRRPGDDKKLTLDHVDWEQFRIIRRNIDFLNVEHPPSSIAVTSALPEEGKTTVALFVALASAAAGRRTLLIECDLRRPVLAARLPQLQASPGVTDFVAGRAGPGDILQTISLDEHRENGSLAGESRHLVCITAGSQTAQPVEVLGSARFREMLSQVESAYDLVVLDTPPMLPVVDARELLPQVDAVVVCARAERLTRDQARSGRAALEQLPQNARALVVTGTKRADERAYGYYAYGYAST